MTVKGLEPEIQRILRKNKQDIRKLEEKHEDKIRRIRDEISNELEIKLRQQRENLIKDKENALDDERKTCTNRIKDQ